MENPFSLSGQAAIVTGGSRGIGKSIAHHLAAMGAKVVVSSRKLDACEAVVAEIEAAGGTATAIACNISRRDECENLVKETMAKWGRLDTFVANAAVNPVYGPLAELPDSAFEKIMTSNVQSAIWFANAAAPHMAEAGGGSFIIVSSIGALKGSASLGAYGISKAADLGVARALWENPELRQDREARTPLRRLGDPDDIGGIAAFLAGPTARFITGQAIVADGGVTIAP